MKWLLAIILFRELYKGANYIEALPTDRRQAAKRHGTG
jgi:hypothetical protein